MGDYLKRVFTQIGDFVAGMSVAKKLAMAVTGVGIIAAFVGLFFWAGNTTYSSLMSNLSPEDSTKLLKS